MTDVQLRAGACNRTAAALIDAAVAYGLCRCAVVVAGAAGIYVPRELTVALLALACGAIGTAWTGATVGKWFVGSGVRRLDGRSVGLARALLREGLGKPLGTLVGMAGLLAIAGRERRGWHDRLAGTEVVRVRRGTGARTATVAAFALAALLLALWVAWSVRLLRDVQRMLETPDHPPAAAPSVMAPAQAAVEVATLGAADEARLAAWIEEHGQAPEDFLVEQCRRFRLVIVGENHWERPSLALLAESLPRLRRAGLRCLAMEWLLARDDALVERLITGATYDRALALELARHHPWRAWGWSAYTDVLESAWRLNASLTAGEPPLRVCGLELPIDLPSLALAGIGDQAIEAPWWERLRVVRVIADLPALALRDAHMAARVEDAIARGERTLVWVGASHSTVGCPGPGPTAPPGRMAFLLARRHPGSVTQVYLHDAFGSGPPGREADSRISALVERLMACRGDRPVAWEVTGSPWASLRDAAHWSFAGDAGRTLDELALSYLYLAPRARIARSAWAEGYVTEEMLLSDLPYYRAVGRRSGIDVRDTASAERALRNQ
jgi:uncharacterized RDD family membrane protein YckC